LLGDEDGDMLEFLVKLIDDDRRNISVPRFFGDVQARTIVSSRGLARNVRKGRVAWLCQGVGSHVLTRENIDDPVKLEVLDREVQIDNPRVDSWLGVWRDAGDFLKRFAIRRPLREDEEQRPCVGTLYILCWTDKANKLGFGVNARTLTLFDPTGKIIQPFATKPEFQCLLLSSEEAEIRALENLTAVFLLELERGFWLDERSSKRVDFVFRYISGDNLNLSMLMGLGDGVVSGDGLHGCPLCVKPQWDDFVQLSGDLYPERGLVDSTNLQRINQCHVVTPPVYSRPLRPPGGQNSYKDPEKIRALPPLFHCLGFGWKMHYKAIRQRCVLDGGMSRQEAEQFIYKLTFVTKPQWNDEFRRVVAHGIVILDKLCEKLRGDHDADANYTPPSHKALRGSIYAMNCLSQIVHSAGLLTQHTAKEVAAWWNASLHYILVNWKAAITLGRSSFGTNQDRTLWLHQLGHAAKVILECPVPLHLLMEGHSEGKFSNLTGFSGQPFLVLRTALDKQLQKQALDTIRPPSSRQAYKNEHKANRLPWFPPRSYVLCESVSRQENTRLMLAAHVNLPEEERDNGAWAVVDQQQMKLRPVTTTEEDWAPVEIQPAAVPELRARRNPQWHRNLAAFLGAVRRGNVSDVSAMLTAQDGAHLVAAADNVSKDTALHIAAAAGNFAMVTTLLDHKADVRAENALQETPRDLCHDNDVVRLLQIERGDVRALLTTPDPFRFGWSLRPPDRRGRRLTLAQAAEPYLSNYDASTLQSIIKTVDPKASIQVQNNSPERETECATFFRGLITAMLQVAPSAQATTLTRRFRNTNKTVTMAGLDATDKLFRVIRARAYGVSLPLDASDADLDLAYAFSQFASKQERAKTLASRAHAQWERLSGSLVVFQPGQSLIEGFRPAQPDQGFPEVIYCACPSCNGDENLNFVTPLLRRK
jgi:hypothetical protein